MLSQAGIARARSGCGPRTTASASTSAAPAAAARSASTPTAPSGRRARWGLVLDQSLLLETSSPPPSRPAPRRRELQSGQLNNGKGAFTVIAVPPGTAHQIAFGCDNGVQGLPPSGCGSRSSTRRGTSTRTWSSTATRAWIHRLPQPGQDRRDLGQPQRRGQRGGRVRGLLTPFSEHNARGSCHSSCYGYRGRGLTWLRTLGVLLHHRAEGGQRGLDVLARAAAHHLVRLDDRARPDFAAMSSVTASSDSDTSSPRLAR